MIKLIIKARNPIFSHLNESLHGIITIRAFGTEEVVSRTFNDHQVKKFCTYFNNHKYKNNPS